MCKNKNFMHILIKTIKVIIQSTQCLCLSEKNLPFPRSSGSAWTTTALPMTEFGPVRGICA